MKRCLFVIALVLVLTGIQPVQARYSTEKFEQAKWREDLVYVSSDVGHAIGVVLKESGEILVPYHLITDAVQMTVHVFSVSDKGTFTEKRFVPKIVAADKKTGAGIIKINPGRIKLKPVSIAAGDKTVNGNLYSLNTPVRGMDDFGLNRKWERHPELLAASISISPLETGQKKTDENDAGSLVIRYPKNIIGSSKYRRENDLFPVFNTEGQFHGFLTSAKPIWQPRGPITLRGWGPEEIKALMNSGHPYDGPQPLPLPKPIKTISRKAKTQKFTLHSPVKKTILSTDGKKAYVLCNDGALWAYDLPGFEKKTRITDFGSISDFAITGNKVFVIDKKSTSVAAFDLLSGKVVRKIPWARSTNAYIAPIEGGKKAIVMTAEPLMFRVDSVNGEVEQITRGYFGLRLVDLFAVREDGKAYCVRRSEDEGKFSLNWYRALTDIGSPKYIFGRQIGSDPFAEIVAIDDTVDRTEDLKRLFRVGSSKCVTHPSLPLTVAFVGKQGTRDFLNDVTIAATSFSRAIVIASNARMPLMEFTGLPEIEADDVIFDDTNKRILFIKKGSADITAMDFDAQAVHNPAAFSLKKQEQDAVVNNKLEFTPEIRNPAREKLTFTFFRAPAGASVNGRTGRMEWTPTKDDVGEHEFTLLARNKTGFTYRCTFKVRVTFPWFPLFEGDPPKKRGTDDTVDLSRMQSLVSGDGKYLVVRSPMKRLLSVIDLDTGKTVKRLNPQITNYMFNMACHRGKLYVLTGYRRIEVLDLRDLESDGVIIIRGETDRLAAGPAEGDVVYCYRRMHERVALLDVRKKKILKHLKISIMAVSPSGLLFYAEHAGSGRYTVRAYNSVDLVPEGTVRTPGRLHSIHPVTGNVILGDQMYDPTLSSLIATFPRGTGKSLVHHPSLPYIFLPLQKSGKETTLDIYSAHTGDRIGSITVCLELGSRVHIDAKHNRIMNIGWDKVTCDTLDVEKFLAERLVLTSVPPMTALAESRWTYTPTLNRKNTAAGFRLVKHPEGMKCDKRTGKLDWTPPYSQVGQRHQVVIEAVDRKGRKAAQSFPLTVMPRIFRLPPQCECQVDTSGKYLVAVHGKTIKVYSLPDGKYLRQFQRPKDEPVYIAGKRLYTPVERRKSIYSVFDLATGERLDDLTVRGIATVGEKNDKVFLNNTIDSFQRSVRSPDGKHLYLLNRRSGSTLSHYVIESGKILLVQSTKLQNECTGIAIGPAGTIVLGMKRDSNAVVIEIRDAYDLDNVRAVRPDISAAPYGCAESESLLLVNSNQRLQYLQVGNDGRVTVKDIEFPLFHQDYLRITVFPHPAGKSFIIIKNGKAVILPFSKIPPMFPKDNLCFSSTPVLMAAPGGKYTYRLKTNRKDVTFKLEKGPEGMKINPKTGLITWKVPKDTKAQVVEVAVLAAESSGKKARQRFNLNVVHK